MSFLVACCDNDSGKLHVDKLLSSSGWDRIILVCPKGCAPTLPTAFSGKNSRIIFVDTKPALLDVIEELKPALKDALSNCSDLDVAVNIFSGSGKLHMAVLSCLIRSGTGIRFVAVTPDGIQEV